MLGQSAAPAAQSAAGRGSGSNDPWSADAWAAAGGPLLPPDDPRASLGASIAAGSLGVDVTA
eukprot:2865431-Alexandrium_andersonii.AAC.1